MQDINENDSVVMYTDNFDTNGMIGTVKKVMAPINRCIVVTEDGVERHVALNSVEKRSFLSE